MIPFKLTFKNKKQVIKWLNKVRRGVGDARPLWKVLTPKIIEFVEFQFRPNANSGKRWKELTEKYKQFKEKNGFPTAIGYRTGRLFSGAGVGAKKKFQRKRLTWQVDPNIEYAEFFNNERSIYKNVSLRLNSFMKLDAKKFSDGKIHGNLTYKWLGPRLRKLNRG